ncbi:hypothetical protein C8A01DRAFT_51448 [Parachaetomium inaequale]|uniref:Uncharacterized protein n=1 Tax=Parachaetomium inaequale TaxID=2588326 RepID=A0AAN6SLA2_9PEZI|nr:hypothetical protein C8A01DRAFT_51448 [Parachaetomium inaequale]
MGFNAVNPQQRPRHTGIVSGDWPRWALDTVVLPQQVMALFPDWLLRFRNNVTESPVLAVERLNSLPRPLRDADKEILVGAVLTMSSSLHLALGLLQEVLPQENSQERLGEILCPTLGHLLASLQSTMCSFERGSPRQTPGASATPSAKTPEPVTPRLPNGSHHNQLATASNEQPLPASPPLGHPDSSSTSPTQLQNPRTTTERFPPLAASPATRQLHVEVDIRRRPETHLVKALQAEMRVQAAIHVAIESLEFAEGQLKLKVHGGNSDTLQSHFYAGYNRLLFRALELQRQELGLPTYKQAPNNTLSLFKTPCPFILRLVPRGLTGSSTSLAWNGDHWGAGTRYRGSGKKGAKQATDSITSRTRPPLKRRMSLADELAMVGEDSESGYQDETSEVASSASELGESDVESCNDSQYMAGGQDESERYSTNGECDEDDSTVDSEVDGDYGDKTLGASDIDSRSQDAPSNRPFNQALETAYPGRNGGG